jgi:hypothetical protein
MQPQPQTAQTAAYPLVVVRPEPPGQYTAQVVGIPEIHATALSREVAIEQVRGTLMEWVAAGQLVQVEVPQGNPLMKWFGHADPNAPSERAYREELARLRREDLEQTLREYDQECSDSSSTPTT